MKPITFSCVETLAIGPEVIAEHILDVSRWSDFKGYGMLPGIKGAAFEVRTPDVVGSRIRVHNTDGSTHVEEIVEWHPEQRITLRMKEFSAPFSLLCSGIEESWHFERTGDSTRATRELQLHARSAPSWPALWLISFLLKKAIAAHLRQLRQENTA